MGKVLQDLSAGRLIPYEMEKSERYKNARKGGCTGREVKQI